MMLLQRVMITTRLFFSTVYRSPYASQSVRMLYSVLMLIFNCPSCLWASALSKNLNTLMRKLTPSERTVQEPMRCYGILNEHLASGGDSAWSWAQANNLPQEVHLNRCRYWIPTDSTLESEFVLRYWDIIHRVPGEDYV
jgi:hypothetical protein